MELEKKYAKKTGLTHRKKYAQFFTPQPIADLMTDWLIGNKNAYKILEPAFGLGIFSRTLLSKKSNISIKGFDIDERILTESKYFFDRFDNVSLIHEDYMFTDWDSKYDGIICNPPYFKFHDYDNKQILKEIKSKLNIKLNGFTNLYTLFLLKSIHQLNKNGRAAYIIPSEFLNADYGKFIKQYLLKTKMLRHLFIIDFKENVFDEVMTTASILLFAKDENTSEINISTIESVSDLKSIQNFIEFYPNSKGKFTYAIQKLDPFVKWRKYYQTQNSIKFKHLVPFSTYAKVVRGIATGANAYFTFKPSKAKKYSIPESNLLPCICKAKDVKSNFFTIEDFQNLIKADEQTFLFNGKNSINEAVINYIKKGEMEKINEKYLTKNRTPWYALENRPPSPIWVSVFNRNGIKFIRNEAKISNLTTFHCVYPTQNNLFSNVSIDLLFAYLLTDVAKEIFNDNRREYGNGLKKFEPNDLNKSKILDLSKLSDSRVSEILEFYFKFKKTYEKQYLNAIDSIFRNEFTQITSDTFLQVSKTKIHQKVSSV